MTSRLEEIYIDDGVVDISAFLKQACIVSGDTPQSKAAWPNLRVLRAHGSSSSSPSDDLAAAAEFHDSVTKALPHIPNIYLFQVTLTSPYRRVNKIFSFEYAGVIISVPPRNDRSAMQDGNLILSGAEPDEHTVDAWQQIAQRHWHCKLARDSEWS
ncbi:hypothetical protein LA080_004271 [Diaporthe eres]|nr:hypothetical protein LA080_004271 [Diaporthe eres]